MTSLLAPAYELTLGSTLWTSQVAALRVSLNRAPLVDTLSVRLPASAVLDAQVGDPVSLVLDSGEQRDTVFSGAIDSIRRGFDMIRVGALNAGGALARYRPAVTYEQISAGTVVRNLAGDAGAGAGDVADGVTLAFYVADPSRTAWEHVARVAGWSGALARVSSDNQIEVSVLDATQAELALLHGRELISIDAQRVDSALDSWVIAGEGGAGDSSAPEALRPSTDFFAGNRPSGPGLRDRWRFEPALRTASAAGTASAALRRQYTASREPGRLQAFLQPKLRAGTVFEIQELPDALVGGPVWAAGVDHVLHEAGARTSVRFYKGGDAFDPAALLGSLAGALGGLL